MSTTDLGDINADRHSEPRQVTSMIRSEERLSVEIVTTAREVVRMEKFIVTEEATITVTLRHEEVRLVREPVSGDRPLPTPESRNKTMILRAERPVISTAIVPVERVWLEFETIEDVETIERSLRSEHIDHVSSPRLAGTTAPE